MNVLWKLTIFRFLKSLRQESLTSLSVPIKSSSGTQCSPFPRRSVRGTSFSFGDPSSLKLKREEFEGDAGERRRI